MENQSEKPKKAAFIVNTKSRRGQRLFEVASRLLKESGLNVDLHPVRNPDNLVKEMDKILKKGHKLVILGGGDGTISELVDQVAYTDVVLGILPMGTANSFTRSLGIPANLRKAIQLLSEGRVVDVDLGKINDDYFANAVSIGFTTGVAEKVSPGLKRYLSIVAYGLAGFATITNLRPIHVKLSQGKNTSTFDTYQIILINGGFYGPAPLQGEHKLKSGTVTLFTLKGMGPLRLAWAWVLSLVGLPFARQEKIDRLQIKDPIHLEAHPKQKVSIDGEVKTSTPITISSAPAALKILVPQQSVL